MRSICHALATLALALVPAAALAEPEETRAANVPSQEPAFANQTRAPKPETSAAWRVEEVAEGLRNPWAIEFIPDGRMLVTEQRGALLTVGPDGDISEPVAGVPEVYGRDQGGLLDIALSPDFETSRRLFFSFAEPREEGMNATAVATGILNADATALSDVDIIFRQQPAWDSSKHFGSRIVFAPDGKMFVTLGERSNRDARVHAQNVANHIGTVVRLNPDGSVPEDNPFVGREGAAPEIWSYGHRNIQSAVIHPETGDLWTIEHGPRGGDELNRPQAGLNYGWPVITYGENYSGTPVGEGITKKEGMEQPVYYWDPVIAPSGMEIYTGALFPEWQGDIFVGGLRSQKLVRLVMDGNRVAAEEWLQLNDRIRDVRQGPDGALYMVTDERRGRILKLVPDGAPS